MKHPHHHDHGYDHDGRHQHGPEFLHGMGHHRHMRDEGGPRHRGRGGPGGRRRMFDSGELRLVLLHLMAAQPRHGYDLIREIENRTGGGYAPSPGIVYPTLTMLEDLELIQATTAEGTKRAFALTPAGTRYLAEHQGEAETALKRLEALRSEGEQVESGPIHRAMRNLKTVLEQRLSAPQDKQSLFDIADFIDEAARKIERLP